MLQLNFKLTLACSFVAACHRVPDGVVVGSSKMTKMLQHSGYEEERLQRVAELLPCREVQAGMLLSLMGQVCGLRLVTARVCLLELAS